MSGKRSFAIGVASAVSLGIIGSAHASPAPGFVHTWNMQSGPAFDDFHANYALTGGGIQDLALTIDEPGGGVISSTPATSMIDIVWPALVGPSQVFQYEFNTTSGAAEFVLATLTKKNASGGSDVVGDVKKITSPGGETAWKIFDPSTGAEIGSFIVTFVPAPGVTVLLACAFAAAHRRRRN